MLSASSLSQVSVLAPAVTKATMSVACLRLTGLRYISTSNTPTPTLPYVTTPPQNHPEDKLDSKTFAQPFPDNIHQPLPTPENTHLVTLRDSATVKEGKFLTPAAFPHPGFDNQDMEAIHYEHRPPKYFTDYLTFYFMRTLRRSFDFCTGYIEPRDVQHQIEIASSSRRMTKEKWMTRLLVLESIAGIPGSVAGFLRHLHSMRRFRRDKAFVQTLEDEAYNERMHLLTFLKLAKPGWFARGMLWFGQGMFCNLFFLAYLTRPAVCHRFVGYLEEEAVLTYTRCLDDMRLGLNPELYHTKVPQLSLDYWNMSPDSTFYDLILYIRADEAKHREVNHTFANLKLNGVDRNPFALSIDSDPRPQPHNNLKDHRGIGWEREDLIL